MASPPRAERSKRGIPAWILPLVPPSHRGPFRDRYIPGFGYAIVRDWANTRKLRNLVRKLPPGNALREFILKDPESIPMSRLEDYWNIAVHALLPR